MQIVVIDGLLQLHDVWSQAQYIKIVDFGNSILNHKRIKSKQAKRVKWYKKTSKEEYLQQNEYISWRNNVHNTSFL